MMCDMNALRGERSARREERKEDEDEELKQGEEFVEKQKYSNPIYLWLRFIQWHEFTWTECIGTYAATDMEVSVGGRKLM